MKLDNADHVFSIGMQQVSLVLHTRVNAHRFAIERRGLSEVSGFVLPIPLAPVVRTRTRTDAKRTLGVPENDVLMLSIGSAYKFHPYGDLDFIATHVNFLKKEKRARMVVLGPAPSGAWKVAEEQTAGRLCARGYVHEPTLYVEAADIAVESFPIGSITAVLEAASYGNPVVSLRYAATDHAQIYRTDDPGLTDLILLPRQEAYESELAELVKDSAKRHSIGAKISENISQFHHGTGWRELVARAYAFAKPERHAQLTHVPSQTDEIDLLAAGIHHSSGFSRSMKEIHHSQIGGFPLTDRIRAYRTRGASAPLKTLLPDWLRGYMSCLLRGTVKLSARGLPRL